MCYVIIIGFFVVEVILMHINTQASKPPFGERWKGQESTNDSAGSSLTHHQVIRSEHLCVTVLRNSKLEFLKGFSFPILILCLVMALPLSKVMNSTAFCVMNPFDDFCQNLDFECLDILRRQSANNPDLIGSRNHDYGEIIGNVQHELAGLNPQVSNVICFIALPVGSYFTIENVSITASDTNFIRLMDWIS